ncbi:hypothetical protein ACA910_012491 [Epithemia clementina (nom. ined.)]
MATSFGSCRLQRYWRWGAVLRPKHDQQPLRLAAATTTSASVNVVLIRTLTRKVAIVGSGPSGCYTAKYLRAAWDKNKEDGEIDVIERLPTPYGLVRYGVAPDHPEVKNVQNDFDALFEKEGINYYGNVQVGRDVSIASLREIYDAVVLATGCQSDRRLGLEGEKNYSNILSAREFVAWYNGHPDFVHIGEKVQAALGGPIDEDKVRDGVSVVVVGHGNVALDCARVLAKGGKGLYDTDIASHVLQVLGNGVAHVSIVGRRGHIQGAFTIKEVRELVNLQEEGFAVSFVVREEELDMGATKDSLEELESAAGRPKQRINKLLRSAAAKKLDDNQPKRVDLRFLLSPSSWEPSADDPSRIEALVCERTRLEGHACAQRAVGTGEFERIPAHLALLSIGYKADPMPGLENHFDFERYTVRNERGRVERPLDGRLGGLYVAGWLKRGPSGIIGTNIPDAKETVASILDDLGSLEKWNEREVDLLSLLQEKGIQALDWGAYRRIDEKEKMHKRAENQPREKITDMKELIKTALHSSA